MDQKSGECKWIEKAHLFAPKTPNDTVYGETGRTPLHLDAKVSSIRSWLKLMRMEAERLPRKLTTC